MSAVDVGGGSARALSRRLADGADRLALHAALTDRGLRADTMFLETLAGASLILDRAAVRIECRGPEVELVRLTAGGGAVLRAVEQSLSHVVAERSPQRLRLRFQRVVEDDAERRLLAPSPFDALRAITQALRSDTPEEPFAVTLIGAVSFDHVDIFEELPPASEDPVGFPDFIFWLAESLIVFEQGLTPRMICTSFGCGDAEEAMRNHFAAAERIAELGKRCDAAPPMQARADVPPRAAAPDVDLDDDAYAGVVRDMKEHVLAGDVYQIVPSRTFSTACSEPLTAFARLRTLDRSPYMFFLSAPEHVLFGASPETSVRVVREKSWPTVEVNPIAGTRPRGANADEDDRMEADLRLDQKELAEHMMLVDLARNDVARVSLSGTRRVAQLMTVERYARVMHLVSSVKGALAIGFDALHALQACLNVGTLSGAPKLKATELLRKAERTKRGPYGGAIGWLNGDGALDTGVIIRSAVVRNGVAYVRAGAGVVHDSDPSAEAEETRRKASAVLSAISSAEASR